MPSEPPPHDHTPAEERAIRDAALDETIEGSFPASDPPSSNPNPDDHDALERHNPSSETAGGDLAGTGKRASAERTPAAVVKRMFDAFGAGDLEALLDTVHPDSRWTYYGANPRLSAARFGGHAEIRRFFEQIGERLEMTAFNTVQFVADGDVVVIFGNESGRVKATGQRFRNEWAQKYVVRDGLIAEMVEYNVQVEPRGPAAPSTS